MNRKFVQKISLNLFFIWAKNESKKRSQSCLVYVQRPFDQQQQKILRKN